ncbi:heavy-metal-associated domain-containing protein [Methanobrevibacter sp. DSM 116169]|uniref:heavy-metal-associated domain-containing protein n=1 Tax=Methanobrevibacter sp. DSM 116169 TaxID=3242727 RepID=UPI0038FD123D
MSNNEIKVNGLHCSSCVFAVENSIKDLDGVEDAKADLDTGIVKLTYDDNKVSLDDIDEAVKEAGFSMEK